MHLITDFLKVSPEFENYLILPKFRVNFQVMIWNYLSILSFKDVTDSTSVCRSS